MGTLVQQTGAVLQPNSKRRYNFRQLIKWLVKQWSNLKSRYRAWCYWFHGVNSSGTQGSKVVLAKLKNDQQLIKEYEAMSNSVVDSQVYDQKDTLDTHASED